jgi:1-pyrroline-5-carboxylate dehydrogenase
MATKSHVKAAINAALESEEGLGEHALGGPCRHFPEGGRLDRRPLPGHHQCGHHVGPEQERLPGRDRCGLRVRGFPAFNVHFMQQIYRDQPYSPRRPGTAWNTVRWKASCSRSRPSTSPAIAGNLPSAAALMGNVAVWKCADSQIYSAQVIMDIFRVAGLPDGVINLIHVSGRDAGEVIFTHPDFAGIHFTGSTSVFQTIWATIGANIHKYKSYPRIVGETGGKDFVIAHPSADPVQVATALSRGAFEFQGQKVQRRQPGLHPSATYGPP